jgi:hypothetical protein
MAVADASRNTPLHVRGFAARLAGASSILIGFFLRRCAGFCRATGEHNHLKG